MILKTSTRYSDITKLHVSDLGVQLGRHQVLTGITFSAASGELIGVVGPNGAGKSTLFRALAGLLPYSGKHDAKSARAEYVPQQSHLDLTMPIRTRDVVLQGLRPGPLGNYSRSAKSKASAQLSALGLGDKTMSPLDQLSGGQRQRSLLGRALVAQPDILLLDETLNGVDIASQQLVLDAITELLGDGGIVLIATHDLGFVRDHTSRCLVLNHSLIADDRPSVALSAENIERAFLQVDPEHC